MSFRDSERYRKVYSYYRPVPRPTDPGGVSKEYVDEALRAMDWKQSVKYATTGTIVIATNGSAAIDGADLLSDEDRILVKDQASAAENGIYMYYSSTGALTRTLDATQDALTCGATVYVESGSVNENRIYTLVTQDPVTVGTTAQTWSNIIGGGGSPGSPVNSVQFNDAGSFGGDTNFTFNKTTDTLTVTNISGSLTRLSTGASYILAGPNITVNTNSLGQVEVTGSAGGGGGDVYWSSTAADSIYTSGSVAIRGLDAAVDSPSDIGTDVFFWVSGSLNDGLNRSVFGGDVRISGSLVQGGAANIASGISSHAEGVGTQALGVGTHAEGINTYAYQAYSHAEGNGAQSLGLYSHAEGLSTITNAAADGSHAEGNQSQTYAYYSHAEGQFTVTYGESSHAEGIETVASGTYSHAEGYLTYASGTYSHAEGEGTLAVTSGSHSEGFGSTAGITALSPWDGTNLGYAGSGILKLATDYGDVTSYFPAAAGIIFTDFSTYFLSDVVSNSSFDGTHTFITASSNTTLGGPTYVTVSPGFSVPAAYEQPVVSFTLTHAHAEGYATHAAGAFSHAEGYNSKAVGGASHAEGEGTWAFGGASHTEGTGSVAIGTYAHAGGIYTIASGSGQTVIGQYNLHDNMDSLFVVGDGSGDDSTLRHDVLRVNSGSVQVTGSLLLSGVLEWQANIQGSYVKLFTSPLGYSTNLFGDVDQVGERLEFPNLNDNFITATGPTGSFSGVNGGRLHIRAGDALGATGVGGDLYIDPGGSGSLGDRPGMLLFGVKKGASLIGFSGGTTAASAGSDAFFVVSGSVAGTGADDRRAVFVGDVVTSGSYLLNVQSGTLGTEPVVLLVSSSHHLTVFTLGNVTASLPAAAHVGTQLIFKDGTGAASTSPQMVSCSVGLLDGGSTYTLPAVNYSSVTVVKVEEPDTWVVV